MAGAPRFKVYDAANVYQAAVRDVTLAAAVVSLLGEGATVRDGRRYIWREGGDEIAGESYDEAADTMLRRIRYNQTFKAKREPLPEAGDPANGSADMRALAAVDAEHAVRHGRRCAGCHQELGDGEAHKIGQCPVECANPGCADFDRYGGAHYHGNGPFVWTRLGDNGDYTRHDSILDAGEHVAERVGDGVTLVERYQGPTLTGVNLFGTGYVDTNGVSLFYGDGDAQKTRELTDDEIGEFAAALRGYDFEGNV